ncbi:hypothetical protein OKW33_001461 [Paraburkholderia atlantica]
MKNERRQRERIESCLGFSDAEYASKKKLTRRDRLLAEIEAATPWSALAAAIEPVCTMTLSRI